jgi:ABC-2 type transport system ATP-binding protein
VRRPFIHPQAEVHMIEVRELTKKYGELVAVRDLTFKVEPGRIWGLLGPNAAGKTTTMRILTGYLPATSGRATVAGYDVFDQADAVKRSIGYLPEVVPLYEDMTVSGYLTFVAEIKQVPRTRRKAAVARVVESASLKDVARRLIKNISRGYKQRVGIAQAMIHDPKVLVLDEPTIGLDPAQIREIRELIRDLRGEHTILLSTHILPEVTQVCDGVVIVNEGRLMASGSLEDLAATFEKKDGVVLKLRRGGAEEAALFRGLPGVEKVAVEASEIRVEWSRGRDLRDDVARLALDKGLGLNEMRSLAGIEDLYMKVVSGGLEQ